MKSLRESLFDSDLVEKEPSYFGAKYKPTKIWINFNSGSKIIDKYKEILNRFPVKKLKSLLTPEEIKRVDEINLKNVEIRAIDNSTNDKDELNIIKHIKYVMAVVNKIFINDDNDVEYYDSQLKVLFKDMVKLGTTNIFFDGYKFDFKNPSLILHTNTKSYRDWMRLKIQYERI